jgi:hypothetical protein
MDNRGRNLALHDPSSFGGSNILNTPKGTQNKCCKRLSQALAFFGMVALLVLLMMWDLHKAQMLSEIIHDDHVGNWVQMEPEELRQWYTPLDRCMLSLNESNTNLTNYRLTHCTALPKVKRIPNLHLSCNIGATISGKTCHAPLATRTFFTAKLKNPLLGDPSNTFLSDALRKYAEQNKPIVFVGDGVTKQSQDAMLCELLRTDHVQLSGTVDRIEAEYSIEWTRSSFLRLDVHYMKLTSMFDNGIDEQGDRGEAAGSAGAPLPPPPPVEVVEVEVEVPVVDPDTDSGGTGLGAHKGSAGESEKKLHRRHLRSSGSKHSKDHSTAGTNSNFRHFAPWLSSKELNETKSRVKLNISRGLGMNNISSIPMRKLPASGDVGSRNQSSGVVASKKRNSKKRLLGSSKPRDSLDKGLKESNENLSGSSNDASNTTVRIPLSLTLDEIKVRVHNIIDTHNGVVLIVNVGVWYNSRELLRKELPALLSWMNELSTEHSSIVFFRETAAQHWNYSEYGYYKQQQADGSAVNPYDIKWNNNDADINSYNGSCAPVRDATPGTSKFP